MYDEYDSVRFFLEPPDLPAFFGALALFFEGVLAMVERWRKFDLCRLAHGV